MHRLFTRFIASCAAFSLAACSTLHTLADRSIPGSAPSATVAAALKPSDYVVLTFKDKTRTGVTVSSASSDEIVGTRDRSDVEEHFKIEDIQVIQRSVRSPERTTLLVLVATIAGILAFLALVVFGGFHGA